MFDEQSCTTFAAVLENQPVLSRKFPDTAAPLGVGYKVSARQLIGWMFVLGGALLHPPVLAEIEAEAGHAVADVLAEAKVGLNFDTVFETYIGPIPVVEAEGSADSQSGESKRTLADSLPLQLPPSSEINLPRIRTLLSAGAFTLAESLLVAGLPARKGQSDWFDWQRELWEVRENNNQRDLLIESLLVLAEKVEGDQRLEVLERLVVAQQKNRDYLAARTELRNLMLMVNSDPVRTARLRRLLIHNYLESGLVADAEAASIRYQEEYLPDDTEWNLLRGQILIQNDEPSKAVAHLVALQDQKARLMLALARLYEGSLQPKAVIAQLERDEIFIFMSPELEQLRTAIIAEAARLGNHPEIRVRMLENLLAAGVDMMPMLPGVTSERLLETYVEVATMAGNDAHLLLGNDLEWIKHADDLPPEEAGVARAIYAMLLQNDGASPATGVAHRGLIDLLISDQLYRVVLALYGRSAPLGLLPDVGDELSLRLSRRALEVGDYTVAARVANRIKQPPEGVTHWDWQLQIARLEIFSGQSQVGTDRLLRVLEDIDIVQEQELDRLLQVAFDLQAISRHDLALKVFEASGPFSQTVRQRRELLFWMGESQIGESRFAEGADLFLQSSEVAGQQQDLWGQSARFRAAEALVEAGLLQDAFNVYRALLNESSDENRRLQLRQKLQNLNLLEAVWSE
jgi:hypothetical protein